MQTRQSKQLNATSEIHLKHFPNVFHFDLLWAWQGRHRGPFRVLKRLSRDKSELVEKFKVNPVFIVGTPKPICENQENSDRGKSQYGQLRSVSSCKRSRIDRSRQRKFQDVLSNIENWDSLDPYKQAQAATFVDQPSLSYVSNPPKPIPTKATAITTNFTPPSYSVTLFKLISNNPSFSLNSIQNTSNFIYEKHTLLRVTFLLQMCLFSLIKNQFDCCFVKLRSMLGILETLIL